MPSYKLAAGPEGKGFGAAGRREPSARGSGLSVRLWAAGTLAGKRVGPAR